MMIAQRIGYVISTLAIAVPALAAPTFSEIVNDHIVKFVDVYIIPLFYALAFVFFIIGVVRYFFMGGEEGHQTGRAYVLWSLIGMVVLFGLWGIVQVLLEIIPTS